MTNRNCIFQGITIFLTMVFYTVQPANAGWIMEDADGTTTYLGHGKVKSVYENEEVNIWHIINGKKNLITMIDMKGKTYGSGTPADFCNAVKSFSEEVQKQAMAGLPPEQRKIVEEQMRQYKEMMKSAPPSDNSEKLSVSIKKTAAGEVIANHKTDRYAVSVNGEKYEDIWIASEIVLKEEEKKLNLSTIHIMQKRLDTCMGAGQEEIGMTADPRESAEYKKLSEKGLVMREVRYSVGFEQGDREVSTDIVKLEKKKIPESEFKIPSGFKEVPVKNILKGMMGSTEVQESEQN